MRCPLSERPNLAFCASPRLVREVVGSLCVRNGPFLLSPFPHSMQERSYVASELARPAREGEYQRGASAWTTRSRPGPPAYMSWNPGIST